jgi:hypothetical protein
MRRIPSERSAADRTQRFSVFITARDRLALLVRRAPAAVRKSASRYGAASCERKRSRPLVMVQRRK